ncbi:MAG: virulence factor [Anaerolineales bacterium]|nr:virulence factor [Anaerolineales bacterium]
MADVQVYYWKDIPYGVRAQDERGRVSRQMPRAFEAAVDAAAMVEGLTESRQYLAGFRWGPAETRAGTADEVAGSVVEELVAAYPPARLARLARREPD